MGGGRVTVVGDLNVVYYCKRFPPPPTLLTGFSDTKLTGS